jgi:hypothetical protein
MKSHEYADLFPMMATADIARLAEDIRENGQANPIVTFEGKILDGRNRYQACLLVEVDPVFAEYDGTEPLAFVVSHNLHRRHLSESQRGMVAAKMANMKSGTRTDLGSIDPRSYSNNQAAELLNISTATVKRSKAVLNTGISELQEMQMSGEVSAKAASVVAKLPEEEQRKAVSGGVAGARNPGRVSGGGGSGSGSGSGSTGSGTVNDCSAEKSPLNQFRSTLPLMPGTEPVDEYCQNVHLVQGRGTTGFDAVV